MESLELRQTPLRGIPTGWWEGGQEGAPIALFLHGFPDDAEVWEAQVAPLRDRFRVVCPYNRGVGPSDTGSVGRFGQDAVALDLLALLDRVEGDRQRVTVIGHDIGAAIAWHLASLLGPRCQGLVVANGMSVPQMVRRLPRLRQQLKSWYIYTMQLPWLPEWVWGHFGQQLMRWARGRPHGPSNSSLARSLNHYRAFFREAWPASRTVPLSCPVLVLWGEKDPYLLQPTLDELAPFARRVQTRLLAGGHWIQQDNPKDFNRALVAFMDEVRNGTFEPSLSNSRRAPAQSTEPAGKPQAE